MPAIAALPVTKVPYAALALQMRRIKSELLQAVDRVLENGQYVLGPEVEEFEERFASYCGAKYAVGVSDGTSALILALRAFDIGPGDEVITAPNSFIASAACVALIGARPVFVDVREADLNLDPNLLEAAVTDRTRAIIPVHLAGHPADMEPILEIGRRRNIPVIEDAAQSVGSAYHGARTGSMGAAACFSLHPLKNLHAYGDAGIITSNDEGLYRWLLKARNHGLRNRDESDFWSVNSRLDTLQAATLLVSLRYLDEWIAERRSLAGEFFGELGGVVEPPVELPGAFHSYQTYVIKAERRPELMEHLSERGIDAKVHYPIPIHQQPAARELEFHPEDFPVTARLAKRIMSLPFYPELTAHQRRHMLDAINSFYEAGVR